MSTGTLSGLTPDAESGTDANTEAGTLAPANRPRARRWWIWPAVIAVLVVVTAVLGVLGLPRSAGDFDPDSAGPNGTRALVQVLRARGVQVRVVRSVEDLRAEPGSTVLITRPWLVPFGTLDPLRESAADLVLLRPDAVVLDELESGIVPAGNAPAAPADPGCRQDDAAAAGRALAGGELFRGGTHLCYPQRGRSPPAGSVAVSELTGRRIVAIGQIDLMRNEYLAQEGNAALAVRVLGRHPTLEWYIPDPAELTGTRPIDPVDLLPTWVRWMPLQLALAAMVAMLWRGRRLGRLVTEPLPVVVRAAETQEGRARLYRQARARDRAAATLRTATLRRLAQRFQATTGRPEDLTDQIASATGRDPTTLRHTLLGPAPTGDGELVALAGELAAIEQDVSGRSAPATAGGTRPGMHTSDTSDTNQDG